MLDELIYYLSYDGDNNWSGKIDTPNSNRTDGPFKNIEKVREIIRELNFEGSLAKPVTVYMRGGDYPITEPIVFDERDDCNVVFKAYKDEIPIINGGIRISNLREVIKN